MIIMMPHSIIMPYQSTSSYSRNAIASTTAHTDIPASIFLYLTALTMLMRSASSYTALSFSFDSAGFSCSQSALYMSVSLMTLLNHASSPYTVTAPAPSTLPGDPTGGVLICTTWPLACRSCSPASLLRFSSLSCAMDDVPQPPLTGSEPSHRASSRWQWSATYTPACL